MTRYQMLQCLFHRGTSKRWNRTREDCARCVKYNRFLKIIATRIILRKQEKLWNILKKVMAHITFETSFMQVSFQSVSPQHSGRIVGATPETEGRITKKKQAQQPKKSAGHKRLRERKTNEEKPGVIIDAGMHARCGITQSLLLDGRFSKMEEHTWRTREHSKILPIVRSAILSQAFTLIRTKWIASVVAPHDILSKGIASAPSEHACDKEALTRDASTLASRIWRKEAMIYGLYE